MADYVPLFLKREITLTASAAIAGGDLLEVSGDGTVAKCASLASAKVIGVAGNAAAVSGDRVTVYCRGPVHLSLADGTVTAGDQVGTTNTANRQVKTIAAANADLGATYVQSAVNTAVNGVVNAARAVIGIALTTAADNTRVRWMEF